jgi:hypothetical protein
VLPWQSHWFSCSRDDDTRKLGDIVARLATLYAVHTASRRPRVTMACRKNLVACECRAWKNILYGCFCNEPS